MRLTGTLGVERGLAGTVTCTAQVARPRLVVRPVARPPVLRWTDSVRVVRRGAEWPVQARAPTGRAA